MSETIVLEALAGRHIDAVCSEAVELANKERKTVEFDFNGTLVSVKPDSDVKVVIAKWDSDREAAHQEWINSDEYKERERKNAEEWQRKTSAVLTETAASEGDMREVKNPQPYTPKQLADYIDSLVSRNHDCGTAVYAMSLAAVAAFNYVAHKVGSSGFQASCADLDVLRRTRNIEGPFILLEGEDALYPQFNLHQKLSDAMGEWRPWLKEQAEKHLANTEHAHPKVIEHWRKLTAS